MSWSRRPTFVWLLGLFIFAFAIRDLSERNAYHEPGAENLVIFTYVTKETSALNRLRRSARVNQLPLQVLGLGTKWVGFGKKVNTIKQSLEKYKGDPNTVVLIVDGYDVLFNGGPSEILDRFRKLQARILFSAEGKCSPKKSFASAYPEVKSGRRFLNAGALMAYVDDLLELLDEISIADKADDQLYYTKLYINPEIRSRFGFKLDHRSEIFLSLNVGINDTELRFENNKAVIYNRADDTVPLILHANGASKGFLNTMENYIPQAWNPIDGCLSCLEQTINLAQMAKYPTVLIGVFVRENSPPLEQFFDALFGQVYPKDRIDLFINISKKVFKALNGSIHDRLKLYRNVKLSHEKWKELKTISRAIHECVSKKNNYYLALDSTVLLENLDTLKLLMEQNRPVVAPMLFKRSDPDQANFIADFKPEFYLPSMDILKNNRSGLWRVSEVSRSYLVRRKVLVQLSTNLKGKSSSEGGDEAFCAKMRKHAVNMYVSNRHYFGTFE